MFQQPSGGQKAELRATALFVIRSIVERHHGTVDMDLATNTLNISVPEQEEVACAEEIEEQVATMCC